MLKKSLPRRLVELAVGLLATAAVAHAAPKAVKASYSGFMNGMPIGSITEQFESDGNTYRIVSETRPTGLAALVLRQPLRFTSAGRIARDGLRPSQFEARRNPGDAPQVSADFNWTAKQLVLKHHGKIESHVLPQGTQDRLSVMYQFMFLAPERIRQLEFPMTNGRKLDRYRYRATEDVEIETGLGRLKTLHLVKQRDPGDSVSEVWLSPQHAYLPVKILVADRDDMRLEQIIQSLDVRE